MVNYQHGKIYKIVSDSSDKIYIGSTTQKLCKRFNGHKTTHSCASRDIIKNNDCHIILIENYPCTTKEELLARERYWIEQNSEICLNLMRPICSKQDEYDRIKNWQRANKDKVREYMKKNTWRDVEQICQCGGKYKNRHKAQHKKTEKHQAWAQK